MSTVTPLPHAGLAGTVLGEIKAWMGRRGINQSGLATALAMNQSQLSKRLNGKIPLDIDELERIAGVLDVDPVVFFHPSTRPWPNGPHDDGGVGMLPGSTTGSPFAPFLLGAAA